MDKQAIVELIGRKLQRKYNFNRVAYSRNPERAEFFDDMAAEAIYQAEQNGYVLSPVVDGELELTPEEKAKYLLTEEERAWLKGWLPSHLQDIPTFIDGKITEAILSIMQPTPPQPDGELREWVARKLDMREVEDLECADQILSHIIPIIKAQERWAVGEELCCLIGNLMLEDKEAGILLGNQLNEYMKNYLKANYLPGDRLGGMMLTKVNNYSKFWMAARGATKRVLSWPEWKRNVKVTMYSTGFPKPRDK